MCCQQLYTSFHSTETAYLDFQWTSEAVTLISSRGTNLQFTSFLCYFYTNINICATGTAQIFIFLCKWQPGSFLSSTVMIFAHILPYFLLGCSSHMTFIFKFYCLWGRKSDLWRQALLMQIAQSHGKRFSHLSLVSLSATAIYLQLYTFLKVIFSKISSFIQQNNLWTTPRKSTAWQGKHVFVFVLLLLVTTLRQPNVCTRSAQN